MNDPKPFDLETATREELIEEVKFWDRAAGAEHVKAENLTKYACNVLEAWDKRSSLGLANNMEELRGVLLSIGAIREVKSDAP